MAHVSFMVIADGEDKVTVKAHCSLSLSLFLCLFSFCIECGQTHARITAVYDKTGMDEQHSYFILGKSIFKDSLQILLILGCKSEADCVDNVLQ